MQIFHVNIYNFRHFLHILLLFRRFFYTLLLLPDLFFHFETAIQVTCQDEQVITQAVYELQSDGISFRFYHSALSATANSAANMACASHAVTCRKYERTELRQVRLRVIYPMFQLLHIRFDNPCSGCFAERCAEVEQFVLNPA